MFNHVFAECRFAASQTDHFIFSDIINDIMEYCFILKTNQKNTAISCNTGPLIVLLWGDQHKIPLEDLKILSRFSEELQP